MVPSMNVKAPAKRALVTGGSSGIGLAVAKAFRAAGHEVLIYGRDQARLDATSLPAVAVDVLDTRVLTRRIATDGPFDIVVANAGGAATAPALKMPHEMWDQMIALNLTSVFHCAQAAVPAMIERGWGRFIVMASTASLRGFRYGSAYAAAKHGVLGFVRSLALELAKTGVTANALCPSYVDTPLISGAIDAVMKKTGRPREEIAATFTDTSPMGRLVTPEEVAAAAVWLASDEAASVTGQAIPIDGGATA
jgi:NAD(P)-dependent dehydrogenase (short-subunit alcohol dehydrogenase family)